MPKAIESEKNTCPYADAQTPGLARVLRVGGEEGVEPVERAGQEERLHEDHEHRRQQGMSTVSTRPTPRSTPEGHDHDDRDPHHRERDADLRHERGGETPVSYIAQLQGLVKKKPSSSPSPRRVAPRTTGIAAHAMTRRSTPR